MKLVRDHLTFRLAKAIDLFTTGSDRENAVLASDWVGADDWMNSVKGLKLRGALDHFESFHSTPCIATKFY